MDVEQPLLPFATAETTPAGFSAAYHSAFLDTAVSLSVVIPASNAADHLGHLLAALTPQLAPGDECIVVNDGSADNSEDVAARFPVRLLRTDRRSGPAAARNLGARSARGRALVFLDADVVPHPDVLERFRRHLGDDPSLAAVIGSYDDGPLAPGWVSRYRNLLHCYTHRNGRRTASIFWAGCGAIRRDQFWRCRGFDESSYPLSSIEDIELGARLRQAGERIILDPEVQVQHRKAWPLAEMLRTDLHRRAVPWSELILRSGYMPDDLNLRHSQRVSAAMVALAAAASPVGLWSPAMAAGLIAGLLAPVIGLNWQFYRFLAGYGGWKFALVGVPLHLLYFLCAALGFLIALVRRCSRRTAPRSDADAVILSGP